MKVGLEIEDLKTTIDSLNNAYIMLATSLTVIENQEAEERLKLKLSAIRDLYNQLLKYE